MPMASMSANIVVGPTKANPRFRSALESASDCGVCVGISARVRGRGRVLRLERPDEVSQAAVGPQRDGGLGVGDGRGDLQPVADDPGIGQEPLDVGRA